MKNIILNEHMLVGAVFKVQTFNATGKVVYDGPWFNNLVLDCGLDLLADYQFGDIHDVVNVGTGSSSPTVTQTGLDTFVASAGGSGSYSYQTTNPAYGKLSRIYEFGLGVAEGNLTEVGLSRSTNADYFNRQLFRDGVGDPTTITVLSDEGLRIYADIYLYTNLQNGETVSGSFTYNGSARGFTKEEDISEVGSSGNRFVDFSAASARLCISKDSIGFPAHNELAPSGSTYSAGSFERTFTGTWLANELVGDYNTLVTGWGGGSYPVYYTAFRLDTPISLTDTEELTISFKRSWGRYVA